MAIWRPSVGLFLVDNISRKKIRFQLENQFFFVAYMRLNSDSIVFYYLGLLDIAYFDHEIDTPITRTLQFLINSYLCNNQ